MPLTQQRKDEITAEMMAYLAANETHTFNAMTLAWAYKVHASQITPLIRKWVKDGLIVVAYVGCTGANNYRSARGTFASLLEASKTDPVAKAAASDFLQEQGRAGGEEWVETLTRGR